MHEHELKTFSVQLLREITFDCRTICPLGFGQFGQVSKGLWYSPAGPREVAIKMLQDESKEAERVKFLQEAAIMGQFHHPNVITLHGVVTMGEPVNKAKQFFICFATYHPVMLIVLDFF